jgi:hypothetical protein
MNRSTINPSELHSEELPSSDNKPSGAAEAKSDSNARRGFASMTPERRREVASNGGRMAHKQGVAHRWTQEEASRAGKKSQSLRRSKG